MDSLITAAARALAAGDPLGALKRVALRDDAPALALRGIAMAQLGDLARAKALLRQRGARVRPARSGGAGALRRRRSRDRARRRATSAGRRRRSRRRGRRSKRTATARTPRTRAISTIRRLLLIGRLDEAERALAELDAAPLPPALRAAHELVVGGHRDAAPATRSAARAALARAERAARAGRHPRADAPRSTARRALLDTPAARLHRARRRAAAAARRSRSAVRVEALVVDACRHAVRDARHA